MVIVKISSGLGNQMFQYAFALMYKLNHPGAIVKLDITDYRKINEHGGYYLDKVFDVKFEIATDEEINEIYYRNVPKKNYNTRIHQMLFIKEFDRAIDWILRQFSRKHKHCFYNSTFNSYIPAALALPENENWYLGGYWQNSLYFEDRKEYICDAFKFNIELSNYEKRILSEIQSKNAVAIHLRRGDYVGSSFDLCSRDYYIKALEILKSKVKEDVYFYIFTDDREYARELFSSLNNSYVVESQRTKCEIDMYLMTKCKHHIIANSTFSFWGAYLCDYDNQIVIAPKIQVIKKNVQYVCGFPRNWIYIDNVERNQ